MELHCPVILFTEAGKVLVFKRSDNRAILPGKWEFGCAKPNGEENIIETLKREYKEDFNINIKILCHKENPVPISSYEVKSADGKSINKGVVFVGFVDDYLRKVKLTDKHSDFITIKPENLLDFPLDPKECIPEFYYSIERAYNILRRTSKHQVIVSYFI